MGTCHHTAAGQLDSGVSLSIHKRSSQLSTEPERLPGCLASELHGCSAVLLLTGLEHRRAVATPLQPWRLDAAWGTDFMQCNMFDMQRTHT